MARNGATVPMCELDISSMCSAAIVTPLACTASVPRHRLVVPVRGSRAAGVLVAVALTALGCADDTTARLDALERRMDRFEAARGGGGVSLEQPRSRAGAGPQASPVSPTSGLEHLELRLDTRRRARLEARLREYEDRLRERYPGEPGSPERRDAIFHDVIRRYRERRASAAAPTPTTEPAP